MEFIALENDVVKLKPLELNDLKNNRGWALSRNLVTYVHNDQEKGGCE